MYFTDTHTHLYLPQFDSDRNKIIQNAIAAGVNRLLIPNVDSETIEPLKSLCSSFPDNCFPMMGLHPTSVKENYRAELDIIKKHLFSEKYIAVGEIGIDLYWEKSSLNLQIEAFKTQLNWAKDQKLPVVIHVRNSFSEVFEVVEKEQDGNLFGVFHCFSGNIAQAQKAIDLGFLLGIGGVVTFKNSGLEQVVKSISLNKLVLETDSPYLAPDPYRGKRNESSYIPLIAKKIAEIKGCSVEEIAKITTENAAKIFAI
ncbi:MAG: hydrolase TatD [Bacteroidetes bacterium GWF2_38_335]|nr:MAG: hydrolase TatD [Bacteroidetes bacterium GWF2_38_335]OFY77250.1 MAG: hydrolase TatD [Bacteroidetes bacterium RIFOXYA12_FULL_38_20]HBS85746.1 hydrolase TatD [Bacteroidales bacterium]